MQKKVVVYAYVHQERRTECKSSMNLESILVLVL